MRIVFFLLLQLACICSTAQQRCTTADYVAEHIEAPYSRGSNPSVTSNGQQRLSGDAAGPFTNIIKIPVVVHVLYKDAAQNITDAQVKSGIEALNRDFRRRNKDTIHTPVRFRLLAADVLIEFYLATADAAGRPTNGIVRRQTNISLFMANERIKSSSQGGSDGWDSKSYLNIWVGNLAGSAGYATPPGSAPQKDGVVIATSAFGNDEKTGGQKLGRTAVHEVGHWLGLKHIWGDAACGDDGIADTPAQGGPTLGCPTTFRSTCDNGTDGDMYMNFMDYTSDACMNMFTEGQKQRMRSAFAQNGSRASLLQSKGLDDPWLSEENVTTGAQLYPNPATSEITLLLPGVKAGSLLQIFNANGLLAKTVLVSSNKQTLSISNLKPGVYVVKGEGFVQKFIKL